MTPTNARPVKTTRTSLRLIEEVKARDGASLIELTDSLDLAKSTIHNHLNTLTNEGFLVKEGMTFHVGLKFLEFGEYARNRKSVYELAREWVYALAKETNEEVDFTVEENGRIFTLEYALGNQAPSQLQTGSPFLQTGSSFHLHNCASGKAILAQLPRDHVEEIIHRWGLPATTPNTITDESALFEDLEATRKRNYSINDEELEEGYRSVGVPVTYPNGTVFGALCVGAPTYRLDLDGPRFDEIVTQLLESTTELEQEIEQMQPNGAEAVTGWRS
ncbi:MAG: IclR family transcriptional regulator [Halobacteriota archaeon]|uniref:IclR family transcriptional regulator n=1 Tax=Natronomonas sp. TaxID=2184060 RepID=UPI0039761037